VDAYLRDLSFQDPEFRVAERRRRNSVSFLAALGDRGVPSVCQWLHSPDPQARDVAVSALAAVASPTAVECISEAVRDTDPVARAAAARGIRLLVAQRALDAARAWPLANALAADPDASVRQSSVGALAVFDFDHAAQALDRLVKDADSGVATSARDRLEALRKFKNLNPDLVY
jgi:HEAT repeat protein